nr:MAG: hypothetical protein DIU57_16635 [Pseudomonadota bacterium]
MPVESNRLAIDPENLARLCAQRAVGNQLVDVGSPLEVWIDADQRLWPKLATGINVSELLLDVWSAYMGE